MRQPGIGLHDDSRRSFDEETGNLIVSNTDEGKRDAQTRMETNKLIVSNTDEGKRDAQTRMESNKLIVSNTDELEVGGARYKRLRA